MYGALREGVALGEDIVVKRLLGRGGMSAVWLAEDSQGRLYAVKEPIINTKSRIEAERNIAYVRHEGAILALFDHPNICKLYFTARGRRGDVVTVLLFLEYLEGGSLKDTRRPMSQEELRELAFQLAQGLAEVHRRGVVHRDLKPGNVLIGGGTYKIADFGTAVWLHDKSLDVVVSPGGYTAPEQVEYGLAVPQSDIWSLGATLVWAYTRRHPYKYIDGYVKDYVKGPLRPRPPPTGDRLLDEFIAKTLHPDYRRRFADAAEALAFLKGGEAVVDAPVIRIKGTAVVLNQGQIVLGRSDNPSEDLALSNGRLSIYDPKKYISRLHAELAESSGKWYIRDLGSVNKTAVFRDGVWKVVWKNRGVPSAWHELQDGDVVALGYDEDKGPYITAYIRLGPGPL